MTTAQPSVRAAAEASHRKWGASEVEAKLLPRTGARSASAHCTDGLNPVVFFIERVNDKALDAIERIEEDA